MKVRDERGQRRQESGIGLGRAEVQLHELGELRVSGQSGSERTPAIRGPDDEERETCKREAMGKKQVGET